MSCQYLQPRKGIRLAKMDISFSQHRTSYLTHRRATAIQVGRSDKAQFVDRQIDGPHVTGRFRHRDARGKSFPTARG